MVFKSCKSLEKNTEGMKERRGGEREKEMEETEGKKDWGSRGRRLQLLHQHNMTPCMMVSGHHTYIKLYECLEEASITNH